MNIHKNVKVPVVELIHAVNLMTGIGIPLNAKHNWSKRNEAEQYTAIEFDWEEPEPLKKSRPLLDSIKQSIMILENPTAIKTSLITGSERRLILESLNKAFELLENKDGVPQAT